jgi:cellulose synthase/poly-beta-1,6-N-acetylglucosamine synthase-like glycosyltransferase
MTILAPLLVVLGAYLTAYVAYQTLLFAANAFIPDASPFEPSRMRRIAVLIPAHNEELYLPRLLSSLLSQEYPHDRRRVIVIADNCSDGTSAACRPFDVDVLERTDPERGGKGHAIGWALERLGSDQLDAVVVVDADSLAAPGFFANLNLQLERGDRVVQCYNAVANPGQSWFTRLMDVSRTISNDVIHPGKRKLGLSSHLMGNGMCFDRQVLRDLPWNAFTVGEDMEYYARLVLSGQPVGYCRDARVYHQESVTLRQASSQRIRWSSGRFQALYRFGPRLIYKGLATGSLVCLDAALPFVFPNPSLAVNLTLLGLALSTALWLAAASPGLALWFTALGFIQFLMFVAGAWYTKDRLASVLSLFVAPVFLGWKLGIDVLSVCGVGARRWKPTERRL